MSNMSTILAFLLLVIVASGDLSVDPSPDLYGYELYCRTWNSCENKQLPCPDGRDCTIYCEKCTNSLILCPNTPHKCNIHCVTNTGQTTCAYLEIEGRNASELNVIAIGHNDIFQFGSVNCPYAGLCSVTCDTNSACHDVIIDARNTQNTNVSVTVSSVDVFRKGRIYGGPGGSLTVSCSDFGSCRDALIKAHVDSSLLTLYANGQSALSEASIYCPNNWADKSSTCNLNVSGMDIVKDANIIVGEMSDMNFWCDPTAHHDACNNIRLYCDDGTRWCGLVFEGDNETSNEWRCQYQTSYCQNFGYVATVIPTTSALPTISETTPKPTTPRPTVTKTPTFQPTHPPTTYNPTIRPTTDPTVNPVDEPSYDPTTYPTTDPTTRPSIHPTIHLTTNSPTFEPSTSPSATLPTTKSPTLEIATNKPTIVQPTTDTNYGEAAAIPTAQLITTLVDEQTDTESSSNLIIIIGSSVIVTLLCVFLLLMICWVIKLRKDQAQINENFMGLELQMSPSCMSSARTKSTDFIEGIFPNQPPVKESNNSETQQAQSQKTPSSDNISHVDTGMFANFTNVIQRTMTEEGLPETNEVPHTVVALTPQISYVDHTSITPQISYDGDEQMEIKQWLYDKCGEFICNQYFEVFIANGYQSMDFIKEIQSKADLEEIGIVSKGHLTKIWSEIRKLNEDKIENDNIGCTQGQIVYDGKEQLEIKQWLFVNCGELICEKYFRVFISNGYQSLDFIKEINDKSDLEEIGIVTKGHQMKLWAEIKKLKDIAL